MGLEEQLHRSERMGQEVVIMRMRKKKRKIRRRSGHMDPRPRRRRKGRKMKRSKKTPVQPWKKSLRPRITMVNLLNTKYLRWQ